MLWPAECPNTSAAAGHDQWTSTGTDKTSNEKGFAAFVSIVSATTCTFSMTPCFLPPLGMLYSCAFACGLSSVLNRILEVDVMADPSTLLHLLVWYKPVQGYLLMRRKQLDSRAWVAKRTAEVLERGSQDVPGGFVDVEEVSRWADAVRTPHMRGAGLVAGDQTGILRDRWILSIFPASIIPYCS